MGIGLAVLVEVPGGHYGLITARDGRPLGEGEFLARGMVRGRHEWDREAEPVEGLHPRGRI
ncbi:MAG: hypothetical protein ACT4QB_03495 [Gammaproteobacteria bacterium]